MSRTGLLAEFTAQGSFLNYLRQLKLDAESLIPPADEKKYIMHSKWEEANDHVFELFLPGPDATTYAALTSAQLTDRYLRANILAITNHGYVPAVGLLLVPLQLLLLLLLLLRRRPLPHHFQRGKVKVKAQKQVGLLHQ